MKTVIYARVINSVSDEPIENGMVEIEDDHIVYVGEKRECTDSDAQIFDLEGKTVMPGFIDAHAHLCGSESIHKTGDTPYDLLLTTVRDLKDLVDAGVTGVRDMSAFGASLKRAIEAGLIKGPRIMPGGRVMSISSGHCDMNPMLSPEESNQRDLIGWWMVRRIVIERQDSSFVRVHSLSKFVQLAVYHRQSMILMILNFHQRKSV